MTHVHIVTQRERKATSSSPRFVLLQERRSQKASQAYSGFPKPKVTRKHVLTVDDTLLRLLLKGNISVHAQIGMICIPGQSPATLYYHS